MMKIRSFLEQESRLLWKRTALLYIYVNWISDSGQSTRVYTADAASENWPSTMVYRGEAISGRPGDSLDVKYIEDYGKFVGVCVSDRMSEDSKLTFYQSDDGLRFVLCSELSEGTAAGAHNSGFSGRPNGHIRLSDGVYIGYAYGSGQASWGSWATRIQRAIFTLSDSIGYAVSEGGQTFQDEGLYHPDPEPYTMGFYGEDVRLLLDGDPSVINLLTVDRYHQTVGLTKEQRKKVSAKVWDPSIATVDPDTLSVTARKTGRTHITVTYEGFCYTMAVYVLDRKEDYYGQDSKACLMTPSVLTEYTVSLSAPSLKQIRGLLYYTDGSFSETGELQFSSADETVCTVDAYGYIRPKGPGSSVVTVRYGSLGAFQVSVHVTESF